MNKSFVVISLLFALSMVSSGHAWWDDSWVYRKDFTVNDTTATISGDWQVMLNISYDSGMKNDFSDLRFVNSTDNGTNNYWIEQKVDGEWAIFWLKTSEFNTTQYYYYGNPSASSESNGTLVFLDFNFENGYYDETNWQNWTLGGLVVTNNGNRSTLERIGAGGGAIHTIQEYGIGTSEFMSVWFEPTSGAQVIGFDPAGIVVSTSRTDFIIQDGTHTTGTFRSSDGVEDTITTNVSQGELTRIEITKTNTSSSLFRKNYGVESWELTSNIGTGNTSVGGFNSVAGNVIDVYYHALRNVTLDGSEPVVSQGSEEALVTNINMTVYEPTNTTFLDYVSIFEINLSVDSNDTLNEDSWWYSLNGGGNVSFTPNTTFNVTNGSYQLDVWVNNTFGDEDLETIYFTYIDNTTTIDLVVYEPQNLSYGLFPDGFYSNGTGFKSFSLDFTLNDSLDTLLYSVDGGSNVSVGSNTTFLVTYEGEHFVSVFANNSLGHSDIETVYFTWVDTSLGSVGREVGGFITGVTNPVVDFVLNIVLVGGLVSGFIVLLFGSIGLVVSNNFKGFNK